MTKKIGLFGGTFDPIHQGHAVLAHRIFRDFHLDELVFIPAKLPPHKVVVGATAQERYEMAKLTAKALGKGFSASNYELESEGISYSHKTVSHWRKKQPNDAIFFITGSDIFITIGTWQQWEDIFNQCNFIVVNRTGTEFDKVLQTIPQTLTHRVVDYAEYRDEIYGKIILYSMPPVDVSSTEIRDLTTESRLSELLLESVYNYIVDHNLYIRSVDE